MPQRYYSSTAGEMALTTGVDSVNTSIAVDTVAGLPASTPFTLVLDRDTASEEVVTVTAVAGTTLTVVRGEDGTPAVAHTTGATVRHMVTARDLREPQQHLDATTDVHGIGSSSEVVGTTTTQTLTNKTLTEPVVDAPTINTPPANVANPAGAIQMFAGAAAPGGWLLCDGSLVSRTTYSGLFAAIGTVYGAGDGSTTFALPNLKGRVPVGRDSAQAEFGELGAAGGAKTHTLTVAEMPSHTHVQDAHNHTQNAHTHTQNAHGHGVTDPGHTHRQVVTAPSAAGTSERRDFASDGPGAEYEQGANTVRGYTGITVGSATATNQDTTATNNPATATNQNTGGGGAHNNLQPYVVVNYIIKT
jgi:microcystin-dependent protein